MATYPECAFWDFSLAVYAREGVAPACLALQERHGVDVNLLLFCCWCGASGRGAVTPALLARAGNAIDGWHGEVVRGLRAVRARLKREPAPASPELGAALRKRIGAVELEAEHIEQLALAALAPAAADETGPEADRAAAAAAGARRYLETLGAAAPDAEDVAALAAVLAGCFPALSAETLHRLAGTAPVP